MAELYRTVCEYVSVYVAGRRMGSYSKKKPAKVSLGRTSEQSWRGGARRNQANL